MKKLLLLSECVVPENIHPPPPRKVTGNSEGEGVQRQWRVHGKLLFQRVKKHEEIGSNAQLTPSMK